MSPPPTDGRPDTLQDRLETVGDVAAIEAGDAHLPPLRDPVALLTHLEVSGRFHRDGPAGRLYHRGMVSLRENVATDALHISIDGNRLSAHIDRVSPLHPPERGSPRYSAPRAIAHNLVGMSEDALWLIRGRQGDHDSTLQCEWTPGEPGQSPEQAGLLDPRESSWSVQLEARVRTRLDEARLRSALSSALGGHASQRDPLEVVDCRDDDALNAARARLHAMPIAAGDRPPLHVFLARHAAGDVLMLTLNHAASDGVGAVRVLRAIARAYAGEPDPVALDFLAGEELPVRPAVSSRPSLPERVRKRAVERLRNLLSAPLELAADEPTEHPGDAFEMVVLSADETRRLNSADPTHGSTNALVAALHLAIAAWNADHDERGRRLGVLLASDLRPEDWREQTIGNFSVNTRLSTDRRERAGATPALRAIAAQIDRNARARTGVALIAALQRNGLLGLWAKQSIVVLQPVTTNHAVDAAMVCDLGAVDAASWLGDDAGEITELSFSTPSRSPLSVSIGAVRLAGRLNLTLRYPRCLLSRDAARRFAEVYAEQLRSLGAGG